MSDFFVIGIVAFVSLVVAGGIGCLFGWAFMSEFSVRGEGKVADADMTVEYMRPPISERERFERLFGLSEGAEFGFVGKRWVGKRFRVMNTLSTGFQFSVVGADGRTRNQDFIGYAEACHRVVV